MSFHKAIFGSSIAIATAMLFSGCATPAPVADESSYMAVIDAGSSGTRINLFEGDATSSSVKVTTLLEFESPDSSGLSSFAENPADVGEAEIQPLLDELGNFLAIRQISPQDVPVYVLATAGMRNVAQADPAAVDAIYQDVTEAITADGFPAAEVATISGQQEALFSWVDVNYDKGVFAGKADPQGIVEIGGASSQIAFATTGSGNNITPVNIAGQEFNVFGVSYLGMGQNDARAGILNPTDASAGNPCFPNNASGVDPTSYDMKNAVPVNATQSSFNYDACQQLYSDYLNKAALSPVNVENTTGMMPADISQVPGFAQSPFLGLASLKYAASDFEADTAINESEALISKVSEKCSGINAWPTVLEYLGGEVSQFSENSCANATFVQTWTFTDAGLGINPENLAVVSKINGITPTWMRGFVVLTLTGNSTK